MSQRQQHVFPLVFYGPEMDPMSMSSWEGKAIFDFILHVETGKGNDTYRLLQGS